jgi:acid phosphatase
MRRLRPLVAAGLALALLTSCDQAKSSGTAAPSGSESPAAAGTTTSAGTTPAAERAEGLPRPAHVMVAIFENEDLAAIVGGAEAPYLTELAASGAHFTDAHGETHPSQPNYLALFSGSTQGVTDDSCPVQLTSDNLAAQLHAAGETFVGYSEGLPEPGYTGCRSGKYARKHNPWVDFQDLPAAVNQPFSAMPADYADLPTVSFVVPDLCNDMHNCGVAAGDAWAREHLAPYVEWAKANDSLLIVTFDEDSGGPENHIATIVAGAGVQATSSDQRIDHYSLLRTLEDMYGLPPLGEAAAASALTGIWATP